MLGEIFFFKNKSNSAEELLLTDPDVTVADGPKRGQSDRW